MTFDFGPDTDVFPTNVSSLVITRAKSKWPNTAIVGRPLRYDDPSQSIGIYPSDWNPDEDSYEFSMQSPSIYPAGEPTLQMYIITVQAFVKDMTEERGIKTHAVMSKAVRSLLYKDRPLAVGLKTLAVAMDGFTEVIMKRKIIRQKYISNEIDGTFLYLSTLQYAIETETK